MHFSSLITGAVLLLSTTVSAAPAAAPAELSARNADAEPYVPFQGDISDLFDEPFAEDKRDVEEDGPFYIVDKRDFGETLAKMITSPVRLMSKPAEMFGGTLGRGEKRDARSRGPSMNAGIGKLFKPIEWLGKIVSKIPGVGRGEKRDARSRGPSMNAGIGKLFKPIEWLGKIVSKIPGVGRGEKRDVEVVPVLVSEKPASVDEKRAVSFQA